MDLKEIKVTPKKADLLNSMGIMNANDLLHHYPFRYDENIQLPFDQWHEGDKVVFEAIIISQARLNRYGYHRSVTRFKVLYDEEELDLTLFNRPWVNAFKMESRISIFGKYEGGNKVMVMQYNTQPLKDQLGIIPVYLSKDKLSQKDLRKYIRTALDLVKIESFVPEQLKNHYRLLDEATALENLHFPQSRKMLEQSLRTLKYEEFLKFQLMIQYYKRENSELHKDPKVFDQEKIEELISSLPFKLTSGQRTAVDAVLDDMRSTKIMYRLVQGDVGCGKTMVAIIAMYASVMAGSQSALLAPTEILARQHYDNVTKVLKDTGLSIEVLYSAINPKEKEELLERLEKGEIDILIGTHALFQEAVSFHDLGLVITDEQHRFGVEQRKKLLDKGNDVDFLLMSATPIPRTLAVSIYGDMDVSSIEELPNGRKRIITKLVRENSLRSFMKPMLQMIDEGNKCYIVCPAIEKNDEFKARNVTDLYHNLNKAIGTRYAIGYLHGKMNSEEKQNELEKFKNGHYQILISTTVIEVGMDVPDANIMVIYDANRFGMSQIHQLRGRVGRNGAQGYCYLLTGSKDADSLKRLEILEKTTDGFEIAKEDLAIRGPGDLLGKRQSGVPGFILGDLLIDHGMLEASKNDAIEIIKHLDDYPQVDEYIKENSLKTYID